MGPAARDDGLQPLGGTRVARRDPSLGRQPRRARRWTRWTPDARDRFGLPVAQVTFNLHENDKKLIEFGKNKVMEIMRAAGATEVVAGGALCASGRRRRMGATPDAGVCRQVRPHLDIAEPVRLRWQRHADARIGQSRTDDPSARRAHRRLSHRSAIQLPIRSRTRSR